MEEIKCITEFYCRNCKYFAQGNMSSYCDHPEQTDEQKKKYVNYGDGCTGKIEGMHQTRIDFVKYFNSVA